MKRREFLKNAGKLGLGSIMLNGIPVNSVANSIAAGFTCDQIKDRVLVMVNMFGANDTLNTVIPIPQYDIYATNRPTIKIPQTGVNKYIDLDTTLDLTLHCGLHPKMTGLKTLYDAGKLNIVQGVGYPNNNRSHFKSDELWNTAGDIEPENYNYDSGWAGQLFEHRYPGLLGLSSPALPDPPCVELGAASGSTLFNTSNNNNASILLTSTSVSYYYDTLIAVGGPGPSSFPASDYGVEMKYIDDIQKASASYGQRLQNVFNAGSNSISVTYPSTYLGAQLQTVARLIKGGCKSSIFTVHQYGFDTHSSQTDVANPITGAHADLMKDLSDSIKAFQDDITLLGFEDKVLTATYSEFGRTIDENAGRGTDHGGVATMLIVGKGVKPGVTGKPIDLTKVDTRALTDLQHDYREVWATILQDFLGNGSAPITAARMGSYLANKLPIIESTFVAPPNCYLNQVSLPVTLTNITAQLLSNGTADVKWKTASEFNCKEYIVEHGTNGIDYLPLGKVNGSGNSAAPKSYNFIHTSPQVGVNYYRLWQVDNGGARKIYGPVTLKVTNDTDFVVKNFPNPSTTNFNLVITTSKKQNARLGFYDLQGHLLLQQPIALKIGVNNFNYLNTQFKNYKGQIIIHVASESGWEKTIKQILQ
jgi:uncharacterized protein (DUF1501 family)